MDFGDWINKLPLWAVFVLTMAICMGAVEAGAALAGIALRQKKEKEPEGPLGSLVGAVLGLLAFILAFTFGMTASRFDARKQLVLAAAFSLVILMIADIDRPGEGLMRVSQQPIADVQQMMLGDSP